MSMYIEKTGAAPNIFSSVYAQYYKLYSVQILELGDLLEGSVTVLSWSVNVTQGQARLPAVLC